MRPSGQILLQETVRRLPVTTTASVDTASDPLLRSVSSAIAIVSDATGQVARVRCILCDGKGGLLPGAILRISVASAVTGGVEAATFTTGTPLITGDYTNNGLSANIGGDIDVQSNANAEVNVTIPFSGGIALTPYITLRHLWCQVDGAIALA